MDTQSLCCSVIIFEEEIEGGKVDTRRENEREMTTTTTAFSPMRIENSDIECPSVVRNRTDLLKKLYLAVVGIVVVVGGV